MRITLSLSDSANSGTEDLLGIGIAELDNPPPGLQVNGITTALGAGATDKLSSSSAAAAVDVGRVGVCVAGLFCLERHIDWITEREACGSSSFSTAYQNMHLLKHTK